MERPGEYRPLGASWDGTGTNFAVFSSAAAYGGSVTLCLLDGTGRERRVRMWAEGDIWACYVPGVEPGQRYGYRACGPHDPSRGLLFDERVLLLDPYAKAMTPVGSTQPRLLHSLVIDPQFDWGDDRRPQRPWSETVLYEMHVKGISATHPDVPPAQRGTFAGLASPPVLAHLKALGVTAVELMPVHQFVSEQALLDFGLTNYWGYSTIGFFAPHAAYSSAGTHGEQVREFKQTVKALHAAGLEVILDVVYNHTAEGHAHQPALCFRGLANEVYYCTDPADPARYIDTTGTRNSLDAERPEVLRLIMDSLRYWATQMHVDGFRFDLAVTLARQRGAFDRSSAFFHLVHQDPVLSGLKLIAEPWDVNAPDSYQLGRFPAGWAEWNDRYRDDVRDFWRGRGSVAELGYRLAGSSDLYGAARRGPGASINFVTAHDGKTLTDLVTYVGKYNEANGEGNRDGADDDMADNYGVEGPTRDPQVTAVRQRQRRNLLGTVLLSQGVPMICSGDEIGRTQRGNNNAYCQDSTLSWLDWTPSDDSRHMTAFVERMAALRFAHPALRRRIFLTGEQGSGQLPDISWYGRDGMPMTPESWHDPGNRFLGLLFAGDRADLLGPDGEPLGDDDILVLLNAGVDDVRLRVPGRAGARYTVVVDTTAADGAGSGAEVPVGHLLTVKARSFVVATAPLRLAPESPAAGGEALLR